jgi:tetratricopeptide (TPR) repeat protein
MATTEIEKLERRYAENPQGLTFAPLAEVHRKNGDVARALELLKAGLELHPNYIPASIVLGRCHWDAGDLPAAESAFSHVLRLDDENVIALKSLADINERLERFTEAQRWLNRLISIDRSNDEAREQLARLQAAKQDSGAAPVLPPEVSAASSGPPRDAPAPSVAQQVSRPEAAPLDLTAAIAEPAAPSAGPASNEPKTTSPVLEFIDTSASAHPGSVAEPTPNVRETQPAAPEPTKVEGLISGEFVPPKDTTYRLHPELTQEFGSAGEIPDALEVETAAEVELQSSGASEFRVPNAAEDFMEAATSPPPVLPAPSLEVEERPSQPERRPPVGTPEPTRQYSVPDTKGQSVAAFFQTILAARPPGSPHPPAAGVNPAAGGSPTEATQDGITLSSDFAEPVPPAGAASGPPSDATVSFDDFFGAPAGGSNPLPTGSSDPGEDDLDQFQSWLQNLKR